jgi:hypothetical protein
LNNDTFSLATQLDIGLDIVKESCRFLYQGGSVDWKDVLRDNFTTDRVRVCPYTIAPDDT